MRKKSRDQRRAQKKRDRANRTTTLRNSEWPAILFDVQDGTTKFIEEITKAVTSFRFEELPPNYQRFFKDMKVHGEDYVMRHVRAAMERIKEKDPDHHAGHVYDICWIMIFGDVILRKLPEQVRNELLPFNDVRFLYIGRNICGQFRSLVRVELENEVVWHSRLKPTVEVDGKQYIVAYTRHAIDGIKKRINPRWATYAALGDVYAYLEQLVYFQPCTLRNVNFRTGGRQFAVSLFDQCGERFWSWKYVLEVLGENNLNADLGRAYCRLGYCPAFVDGDYLKLGTLLLPGFDKTPENELLEVADISKDEKARIKSLVQPNDATIQLPDTADFSALKWFHENGVPQVIQTKEIVYQPAMNDEFIASVIFKK